MPLLVNLQPAGEYLGEDYYRAGGVPAVVAELIAKGKIQAGPHRQRQDARSRTARASSPSDRDGDLARIAKPMKKNAGFLNLKGNLFDSAIMKTSVITAEFRDRYLEDPKRPGRPSRATAVVFDGPEDYHHRIDDPTVRHRPRAACCSCAAPGPVGYPGAAEVVNMRAARLPDQEGRPPRCPASATAGSRAPRARPRSSTPRPRPRPAAAWPCCKTRRPRAHRPAQVARRHAGHAGGDRRAAQGARGGRRLSSIPKARRPGRRSSAAIVGQMETGAVLEPAVKYQRIAQTKGLPRDNH